ncbi:MAG: 16S rRNA (cytosine(967)-C(5))-methyltransferase RsmB [Thiohalospira sp.]
MKDARAAAARAIAAVVHHGRSLDDALAAPDALPADPRDRALARAIAYGALRHYPALALYRDRLLAKPLRRKEADVDGLLLAGLYQIAHLRIPDHAAVAATVGAVKPLGQPRARGLVNAVLRRFQREREELEAAAAADREAASLHPAWLLDRIEQDWGERAGEVLAANNTPAPMTLRVNRQRTDREACAAELAAAGFPATPHPHAIDALVLGQPAEVADLPGFAAGRLSVQDAAPQLAADLVEPRPGQRILDACAAPGGKTAHLLERCPEAEILALDRHAERLARVPEGLERLGLSATTQMGDGADPGTWWDGHPFDAILLDAPCSGTGVIRRHPDIKCLRREADIPALAARQDDLLAALWRLLRPGGRLVYATCSILTRENTDRIATFLAAHPEARDATPMAAWGEATTAGRRIRPGEADMDGFYYAVIEHAPG